LRTVSPLSISLSLVFSLIGLVLAWQIIIRSFADSFATSDPAFALSLAPENSDALLNSIDDQLGIARNGTTPDPANAPKLSAAGEALTVALRAKGIPAPLLPPETTPQVREDLRQKARTVLLASPLDPRALRILGQLSPTDISAQPFMQASTERSKHEILSNYWMLQRTFLNGDYRKSVEYADILLRSQVHLVDFVAPILTRIAESKGGDLPVKQVLANDPPWRRAFLITMLPGITDARTPLNLMLDLQEHGMPPTTEELSNYLAFLMKNKLYDIAYYVWLQFLPPEQVNNVELLFNGQFRFNPSGLPFDWVFSNGGSMRSEIAEHPDRPGDHALFIEFVDGQVDNGAVKQITTLPPGAYTFTASEKGNIQARRGMRWKIACVDNLTDVLGESEAIAGMHREWRPISVAFTVPANDCPAQQVWLELDARTQSERMVSGSGWFADLAIVKAP